MSRYSTDARGDEEVWRWPIHVETNVEGTDLVVNFTSLFPTHYAKGEQFRVNVSFNVTHTIANVTAAVGGLTVANMTFPKIESVSTEVQTITLENFSADTTTSTV